MIFGLTVVPIAVVTIFELLNIGSFEDINNLSVMRLFNSRSRKFDDLWYWILKNTFSFIKPLTIFATLGISSISESFSGFLNDFYKLIVPFTYNGLVDLCIFFLALLLLDFSYFWVFV